MSNTFFTGGRFLFQLGITQNPDAIYKTYCKTYQKQKASLKLRMLSAFISPFIIGSSRFATIYLLFKCKFTKFLSGIYEKGDFSHF